MGPFQYAVHWMDRLPHALGSRDCASKPQSLWDERQRNPMTNDAKMAISLLCSAFL